MAAGTMLEVVRNYLDITYEDIQTDQKLTGIIEQGRAYLDQIAGRVQDYETDHVPRALLLDYCRYARNNALELFEENFKTDLITLRIGVQVEEYAAGQGYI